MEIIIKQLYTRKGTEIGIIIISSPVEFTLPLTPEQKSLIERKLEDYAFEHYKGEGINIYSNIHLETPAITVIRKLNEIPNIIIDI